MGHWLSQQHALSSGEQDQTLKLAATWNLSHVKTKEGQVHLGNSFQYQNQELLESVAMRTCHCL